MRSGRGGTRHAHVVGLGLIGSSVALGLRGAGWRVTGEDCDAARAERARELAAVDELGGGEGAELVVVATPVAEITAVARAVLAASDRRDLVVTDVGGVKAPIVAAIEDPRFVGGHPMAGSEQEGPQGARAELFVGATWVLTPTERTDPTAFQALRQIIGELGADVVSLSCERHDFLVAVVSHVPHLVAANLMVLAADTADEHAALLRLAAGGFRDMTRIVAGDPAIWPDIFRDNAEAVLEVLDGLIGRLGAARTIVAERDRAGLATLLDRARQERRNLPARIARPERLVECRVPVPDRPAVLAEITTVLGELGINIFDLEIAHSVEGERGVVVLAIDAAEGEKARRALLGLDYRPSLRRLA